MLFVERRCGGPDEVESRKLNAVTQHERCHAFELGVHAADAVDWRAGRQVAEVTLQQASGVIGVDVTSDCDARVGRRVEPAEEVLDVIQFGGVQVFLRADGGPVVWVWRWEYGRLEGQVSHAVGAVLVALTALVLDDIALDVEGFLIEGVQ